MRFLFSFLSVVALAATTWRQTSPDRAQAPDTKQAQDPASIPCTVAGRVITAADGAPLQSARVALIPEHNRSNKEVYGATSDSDGNFTIKNIPPGRYQFLASHSGFVEQRYKAGLNDSWPVFSLSPGEKVADPSWATFPSRISLPANTSSPRSPWSPRKPPTTNPTRGKSRCPRTTIRLWM